jgi:hypothetical protein
MKEQNVMNDEMFRLLQDLIMVNGMAWSSKVEQQAYTEARDRLYKKAKKMYLQYEIDKLDNE